MELVKSSLTFDHPQLNWAHKVNEIIPVYRTKPVAKPEMLQVTSSINTASILREHYNDLLIDTLEYFSVLFLNRTNGIIGWQLMSQGGYSGVVADPRFILKMAILCGACFLILCHNHPSGNLRPSVADRELTLKLSEGAKYMDIKVIDHIILSSSGYLSFADEGLI